MLGFVYLREVKWLIMDVARGFGPVSDICVYSVDEVVALFFTREA